MADIIYPGLTPVLTLGKPKLPSNVNLEIWQGDAQRYDITLTGADGVAIDLTGATAAAVVRESFTAPTSYAFQCTITANKIALYMSSTVSKSMPAGNYVWNLQLTAASGDVRTYMAGDVVVYPEVDH